jgi:hypothetical protein
MVEFTCSVIRKKVTALLVPHEPNVKARKISVNEIGKADEDREQHRAQHDQPDGGLFQSEPAAECSHEPVIERHVFGR